MHKDNIQTALCNIKDSKQKTISVSKEFQPLMKSIRDHSQDQLKELKVAKIIYFSLKQDQTLLD